MFKRSVLSLCLALTWLSAAASNYYVVVPVPGKTFSNDAISITLGNTVLPSGMVGRAYEPFDFKSLLSVTGDPTYTGYGLKWSVISGSLPPGLTLNSAGVLSGTPTAGGTSSFQLQASYKAKNGVQSYQVIVGAIIVGLAAAVPPQAMVGQAYSYDLKPLLSVAGDNAYTGSGVTWSVVSSTLPAGLALRTDGTISGTPTAPGEGVITARATYKGNNGEQTYQVATLKVTVALSAATPPQAIVGQAYSYDLKSLLSVAGDNAYTGSGVTWSVVSSTLPAGLALRTDGTISGTPTAPGEGVITARATYKGNNGEQTYQVATLKVTVALSAATPPQAFVGQAYSYDLKPLLSVTGDNAYAGSGITWTVVSSTLPDGLSLRTDGTLTGTPTTAGAGVITARASYKGANGEQSYQVVILDITVALATASPPQALVGQAYSYDLKPLLTVSGDSAYSGAGVTWRLVSSTLPDGLTLRTDGTIAGTPTASGTGTITVRATYKGNSGEQRYQMVTLNVTVSLGAASPPQAIVGQAYSYDLKPLLSVTGDNAYAGSGVTWSVVSDALPPGLSLNTNGTITGTPTAEANNTFTVRASYRGSNGEQAYQIVSLYITATLAAATPPAAILGNAYSYDLKPLLTVTGDPAYTAAKVTWDTVSSTLPTGLSLTQQGVIAGTPTVAGTGTIRARATYGGVSAERAYSVSSGDALLVVSGSRGLYGALGTQVEYGTADDANFPISMPFSMKWFGLPYTGAYVGSNSYIHFGSGSSVYSGLSLWNPALPGIMFGSGDNSYQRVYQFNGTLKGVAFTRIHWEGTASTSGTVGAPNIVAELTFFAPQATRQVVEVVFGQHNRSNGVFGVSNTSSAGTVSGGTIAPYASYVFQSDASGNNWTITSGAHIE